MDEVEFNLVEDEEEYGAVTQVLLEKCSVGEAKWINVKTDRDFLGNSKVLSEAGIAEVDEALCEMLIEIGVTIENDTTRIFENGHS